jgi:TATA-box binding protein (TBP) (component of TFIID and TFIIIB)
VNVKVFTNGGVQMTGVKTRDEVDVITRALCRSLDDALARARHERSMDARLWRVHVHLQIDSPGTVCVSMQARPRDIACVLIPQVPQLPGHRAVTMRLVARDERPAPVTPAAPLVASNVKVCLINSDFRLGVRLKRDALYQVLLDDYLVVAAYEPCSYPGVKVVYYYNHARQPGCEEGVCCCHDVTQKPFNPRKLCVGDGSGKRLGDCKRVTLVVFQSGAVIVTGANTEEQLTMARRYIIRVVSDHLDVILKPNLVSRSAYDGGARSTSKDWHGVGSYA